MALDPALLPQNDSFFGFNWRDTTDRFTNGKPWSLYQDLARTVAEKGDHPGGIPLPIDGMNVHMSPALERQLGGKLDDILQRRQPQPLSSFIRKHTTEEFDVEVLNQWFSHRLYGTITLYKRLDNGQFGWQFRRHAENARIDYLITTGMVTQVWDLDAELRAQERLRGMISEHAMANYLMLGVFVESSKKSKLHYVFRRARPTIVLSHAEAENDDDPSMKILCSLCLHPLAYYAGTHAGAMVPTDDVIAHLVMMRGDEPYLWRKANQHPPWTPEAGI